MESKLQGFEELSKNIEKRKYLQILKLRKLYLLLKPET